MNTPKYFNAEIDGDTIIFAATNSVGTLVEDAAREEWDAMMKQIDEHQVQHAVIDLQNVDYFGSIMLYLMVRLWKRVSANGGKLAICNASHVGREILQTAKFDSMWPIMDSREAAIKKVRTM